MISANQRTQGNKARKGIHLLNGLIENVATLLSTVGPFRNLQCFSKLQSKFNFKLFQTSSNFSTLNQNFFEFLQKKKVPLILKMLKSSGKLNGGIINSKVSFKPFKK